MRWWTLSVHDVAVRGLPDDTRGPVCLEAAVPGAVAATLQTSPWVAARGDETALEESRVRGQGGRAVRIGDGEDGEVRRGDVRRGEVRRGERAWPAGRLLRLCVPMPAGPAERRRRRARQLRMDLVELTAQGNMRQLGHGLVTVDDTFLDSGLAVPLHVRLPLIGVSARVQRPVVTMTLLAGPHGEGDVLPAEAGEAAVALEADAVAEDGARASDEDEDESDEDEDARPLRRLHFDVVTDILTHLGSSQQTLFGCRLVSQMWRKAVDSCVREIVLTRAIDEHVAATMTARWPRLQSITLAPDQLVTAATMETLARFPRLRVVHMRNAGLVLDGAATALRPHVLSLVGSDARVDLRMLAAAVDAAGVQRLTISRCRNVDSLPALSEFSSLRDVSFAHSNVDGAAVMLALATSCAESLTHLDLAHVANCGRVMETFAALGNLRALNLDGLSCSPTQAEQLVACTSLTSLSLASTDFAVRGRMDFVAQMSRLRVLNISESMVTDVTPLSNLHALESLTCDSTRITSLDALAGHVRFRELFCRRGGLTNIDFAASCPELQTLVVEHCPQLRTVNVLAHCTELQQLSLAKTKVAALPDEMPISLTDVDLGGLLEFEDLRPLGNCVLLRRVRLAMTNVSDIAPLLHCRQMVDLDLSWTPVAAIDGLGDAMPSLARLNLADTNVTSFADEEHPMHIGHLRACRALQHLDLTDVDTAADLSLLDGHPRLRTIVR